MEKTKPLQNYIEEEIKEFEKIFGGKEHRLWLENTEMRAETDCEEELEHFFRQSLHRIAKITASEIVPEEKEIILPKERTIDDVFIAKDFGYNQALSDLQTKIKEFIK